MSGKVSTQKYVGLQAFCKLQKRPADFHTAFTEVAGSNPASPTKKYLQIAGKFEPPIFELGYLVQPYCNAVVGLGGK